MLSTEQFERDLVDLTPGQFEQLVHAVVLKDHPRAQKLKAPDFGADVIDDPASKRPRVWQVKHYPRQLNWSQCQESLDRAVEKWRPGEVTFVFPRDLTGKDHQDFNDKLVGRKAVPVERWTASHLNEVLERYPAIRRSYFPHRTDAHHELLRAARLTETPTDGPAFLEHGLELARLAEELDPHFDYVLQSRPEHTPKASWEQLPFMTATLRGGGHESVMAAFAKPGADPVEATWSFTDDKAGAAARRQLFLGLARGESVELSEGFTARANPAPRAVKAMRDYVGTDVAQVAVLTVEPAGETVALRVSMEGASSLGQPLTFQMRSAPPDDGHDGAWVGLTSGILLYLGFSHTGPTSVRLDFNPTMDLGPSAAENAVATATLRELLTHELVLDGPFLPKSRLDLRPLVEPELRQRLKDLADLYGAMIEIEARTGQLLRLPDELSGEDGNAAFNLVALLQSGRTTGRSELKTTTLHLPADQAGALATRLADTRQVVVPFEQDLLAQTIHCGWARLTFERVTVAARPPGQDGAVALRLEADGDVELQLIDAPLPSDVALDLATGQWRSVVLS